MERRAQQIAGLVDGTCHLVLLDADAQIRTAECGANVQRSDGCICELSDELDGIQTKLGSWRT
jgi:hypothetical protein